MSIRDSYSPVNSLIDLLAGHRVTAIIFVAAKLDIPDLLTERPRTAAELAQMTDTHERSLYRLMRALVALGVCTEEDNGDFKLTEMGTHLSAKSEQSLKAWALIEGDMLRAGWTQIIESIRTGKTGSELAGLGQDRFELMAKSSQAGLFNEGMVSLTSVVLPGLLSAYDFSGIGTLMDVGGGLGELMIAILKRNASMRGIVFDLPHCAENARKKLADAGVANRCKFIAGSFFDSVRGGADAIIMKSIIHDWNDERCVRILQNCHHALKQGARLMVLDRVVPEMLSPTADNLDCVLMDLNMLRGPGGCERTEDEFRELLAKGGFRMMRVVPANRYSVIEALSA